MSRQPDRQIAAASRRLQHLEKLGEKTKLAESAIATGAKARLEAVQDDLSKLKARALTDAKVAQQYADLIKERGQLNVVISQSKALHDA